MFTVRTYIRQNLIWQRPPSWNQLNAHISAIFERICRKFDTNTKNEVSEQVLSWLIIMLSSGNKTANIYVKMFRFKKHYKGNIVVKDIKQQGSIFHSYSISNFTVTQSVGFFWVLAVCNSEVGNFIMVKNWSLLSYISKDITIIADHTV